MNQEIYLKLNTIERVKRFVNIVSEFVCDIDAIKGRYILNGKSILGLFSVDLSEPIKIVIHTEDKEEIKRFNDLVEEFK